jgi:uncharacterized membrane protein YbhN (UPF0104 family)
VFVEPEEARFRLSLFRGRIAVSILGALIVTGLLAFVLVGRSGQFSAALRTAPISLLALAVLLQIVALLARSEAWNVCVRAAGGTVNRRVLFRAAAVGYVASVLNGSVGVAARIARFAAPHRRRLLVCRRSWRPRFQSSLSNLRSWRSSPLR